MARIPTERIGSDSGYVCRRLDRDGVQLAIHEAAAFAPYAQPRLGNSGLTHLYFPIEDRASFLDHLTAVDIMVDAVDEIVVTVIDPGRCMVMFGTA